MPVKDKSWIVIVVCAVVLSIIVLPSNDIPKDPGQPTDFVGQAIHPLYPAFSTIIQSFNAPNSLTFTSTDTYKTLSFSINDNAVYKTAYVSVNGGEWQPITLTGTILGGNWLKNYSSTTINIPNASIRNGTRNNNYIIMYSCTRVGTTWDCHDNRWQLKNFTTIRQEPCIPNCAGKTCGTNGCNGTCGTCTSEEICTNGICVIDIPPEPSIQCIDGIQDGDETGVDCGGSCISCASSNTSLKYLVQDNIGYADIIISPSAPSMVILAANYFQMYIQEMTGVELPISNTPNENIPYHVYIGESTYTDALGITSEGCHDGGFKIISRENYLVMLGEDTPVEISGPNNYAEWDALTGETWTNDFLDYYGNSYSETYDIWEEDKRGSMNAVHEFLYNQGIRWYHPGWYEHPGMGTIIPDKEDISIMDADSIINPDFSMREFYLYSMGFGFSSYQYDGMFEEAFQWQIALRGNSYYEFLIGSLGGPGHGIRAIIGREETELAHPEYYATIDGVLMNEDWPVPDLCSPELMEANVRYIKAMFDIYNISMVSVMPTDGFTSTSDRCKYMEDESAGWDGILSNYVWEYVNNVAWAVYEDPKYRDKLIFAGAYTTYQLPPTSLSRPLAPNIAVVITKWRTWVADEETKEHFQNLTDEWYNLLPSKKVYTYDYYLHNNVGSNTQGVPMFFPHLISEDLKLLKEKSSGEMIEISSTSEWPPYEFTTGEWNLDWDSFAANSFNTYVTARLYWDADLDIDALLEEYYTLYYGSDARDLMKAFVEYSEAHLDDVLQDPTIIPTMRQMLAAARAAAGDTIYGYRIDLLIGLMNSVGTGETQINSCQELTSASTTYKLTADVTSTGTCFTIGNGGVTLDCQGHTIIYGTSGGSNVHAVFMPYTGGIYASTIKNCNIRYSGQIEGYTDAIEFSTSIGATIINNTINVTGTGVWLIDSSEINVTGNTIISEYSEPLSTQVIFNGMIFNNKLSSGSGQGTYLYNTNNVTMMLNNVSSISGYGLSIVLGGNNTFSDNLFMSSTGEGLWEYDTSDNIFLRNTILP